MEDFLTYWLSRVILKTIDHSIKKLFRILEKTELKLIKVTAHRLFNETAKNNDLLPTYTYDIIIKFQ